jgi:prenyltransferase beta subunit
MNESSDVQTLSRRAALKSLAIAGAVVALPKLALGQTLARTDWRTRIADYLQTLARPDGGYAWEDQEQSHLTPTFAVIGCYHVLKRTPSNKPALAEFVRTHHPYRLKKLEQEHREFEYQQIQSLVWLGEDASSFRAQVSGWKKPTVYLKQYEQHGYPILGHEVTAFTCRSLLGLSLEDLSPEYVAYADSRRRANGSFNNTPAADGGDGHVMNTWWGLQALRTLGRVEEKKAETVAWLRACQLPNGGFTWQPNADFAGVDDVAYTWAAVHALKLLGSAPAQRDACVLYLISLANRDGGFGDQPGWPGNPMATFYALEALEAMDALAALEQPPVRKSQIANRKSGLPTGLKVFSIQIEAHGKGSPAEAVDLARALRIHLWGAKNAKPEWIARAQAIADEQKVPVKFFVANEEYGTWVNVPGLGTYSHTSDLVAPAGVDIGQSLANKGVVSWPEFRERRLAPLQKAGGRLVWQFGENEELVRLYLDDSLERGGYAAISTFHFGNPDFTNSEPFLQRYRGRIPFIALQDAHGDEPWWFADMTTGFRTVFLATEPTWDGWLNALKQNWVAAIRHDSVSGFKTWMHAGSREVIEFVQQHMAAWQWWDNPEIQRPLVSIVAVTPTDEFEVARPERGVTIRVRCAFENTAHGRPKTPLTELARLSLDGAEVFPELIAAKQPHAGAYADHHHAFHLPKPAPGRHTASAVVKVLGPNTTLTRTIEFTA